MGFKDHSELQSALLGVAPRDFVSAYLLEPIPFLFQGDLALWIRWKTELADLLEVDPYDIVLTGSGAVGFSLNPSKLMAPFHQGSDVDVAVVSPHHFDVAWRWLRRNRPAWLSLPKKMLKALRSHQGNYIFAGTIATDRILSLLPFAQAWQKALDRMSNIDPTRGRDVNLRVYRDYASLRDYQEGGVSMLRGSLASKDDQSDILTEGE